MARTTPMQALHAFAMTLPNSEEGIACAGTVIEKRTAKVRKKAFLFLGPRDAMLKLAQSLPEAQKLAVKRPDRYKPGLGGWTKISWGKSESPPLTVLKRWIRESYRL